MKDAVAPDPSQERTARRRLDPSPLWGRDSLIYDTPEGLPLLRRLCESELGGEKLDQRDIEDASIYLGGLTFRLMTAHKWQEAEAELDRLMVHPDISRLDARSRTAFHRRLGFCALALGCEDEGLRLLWNELRPPEAGARWEAKYDIRNTLGWGPNGHCPVLWRNGLASEAMTTFIEALVAYLRNRPPKRSRFPRRTSYAKLRRHLLKTFGGDLPFKGAPRGRTPEEILRDAKEACEEALGKSFRLRSPRARTGAAPNDASDSS